MKIKLKEINKQKYCLKCKKITEIEMRGLDGFCCECLKDKIHTKLFTLNPKVKVDTNKEGKIRKR